MNLIPQEFLNCKELFNLSYEVDGETGCWEWKKTLNDAGYGFFKNYRAHRVSYFIHKNKDPHPFLVCHKCDNRKCVNPDHLFLGTDKDNMHDMIAKGRARPNVTGLKSPLAKIDKETLDRMSKDYLDNPEMTTRQLAKQYNLSAPRCYYWLKYNNTPMKHKWDTRNARRYSKK